MDRNIKTTRDIALAAKARRLQLRLTQAEAASRAGVSRQWLNAFEAGKNTAELGLVLRLLDALDLDLSLGAPRSVIDSESSANREKLDDVLNRHRGNP